MGELEQPDATHDDADDDGDSPTWEEALDDELLLSPYSITKTSLYDLLRTYARRHEGEAGDQLVESILDEIADICRRDHLLEAIHSAAAKRVGEITQAVLDEHSAELDDSEHYANRFPFPQRRHQDE